MPVRYVMMTKEAAFGDGATPGVWHISAIEESYAPDNKPIADEEMGARGLRGAVAGPFEVKGGFKFNIDGINILPVLANLLTDISQLVIGPGEWYYTFKPGPLPRPYHVMVGTGLETINPAVTKGEKGYPGHVGKSLKINLAAGQKVVGEFDAVAWKENLAAEQVPTFWSKLPFVYHEGVVKVSPAGSPVVAVAKCKACNFEITNNTNEDEDVLGSRFKDGFDYEGFICKGTMDVVFKQLDEMERFLGGAKGSGQSTPHPSEMYYMTMFINIKSFQNIPGSAGFFELRFNMKEIVYSTVNAQISKQALTIQKIDWECVVPRAGGDQFWVGVNCDEDQIVNPF